VLRSAISVVSSGSSVRRNLAYARSGTSWFTDNPYVLVGAVRKGSWTYSRLNEFSFDEFENA
jgi:hypothetical protein